MKLVTIRSQIREVSRLWDERYASSLNARPKHIEIGNKLREIDVETATTKNVEDIIGNKTWIGPNKCDECKNEFDAVIELGEDEDYESRTTYICLNCLNTAAKVLGDSID